MYDVDWRGVAMALGQLKDIAGPTELEKMKYAHDLDEMGKEKDRAFKAQQDIFKIKHDEWQDNITKRETLNTNIRNISASGLKLGNQFRSDGTGFQKALNDNEKKPMQAYEDANDAIGNEVANQLESLTDQTNILNNMKFGQELRETEGMAGHKIFDEAGVEAGYDYNQSGYVSHNEMEEGLDQVLMMMKEQELDTRGISEGFWSGYSGESKQVSGEIAHESDIISLSRNELKLATEQYDQSGAAGQLTDAEVMQKLDTHRELNLSLRRLKMTKKDDSKRNKLLNEIAQLQIDITSEGYGDYLDHMDDNQMKKNFTGKKAWEKGDKYVDSGFITENSYLQFLNGEKQFTDPVTGQPFSPTENAMMNQQMASEMAFVVKNYNKGRKGNLGTALQDKFDRYVDSIKKHGK